MRGATIQQPLSVGQGGAPPARDIVRLRPEASFPWQVLGLIGATLVGKPKQLVHSRRGDFPRSHVVPQ